jgi:hypothetical protein
MPGSERICRPALRRRPRLCREDPARLAKSSCGDQLVDLPEDERVDLADLGARGDLSAADSVHAAVALDGDLYGRLWPVGELMEREDVERADDRAHGAPDASLGVHEHEAELAVAGDRTSRADLQARRRVAVATGAGKRERGHRPRLDVHTLPWNRSLEKGRGRLIAG